MKIVCISREMGSFGDEVGRRVAEEMNGGLLDKAFLEKRCCEIGADPKTLERYDEKKPGFFASFSSEQDLYLQILQAVVFREALKNSSVVLGRGGSFLLKLLPNCLRFRIVAPREVRLARIAKQFDCNEDKAAKLLQQSDRDRAGFCRHHFNIDWRDEGEYHAVFNTDILGVEDCVAVIKTLCERLISTEAEMIGAAMLKSRIMAQEIARKILLTENISIQFLEIQCEGNKAILFGVTGSELLRRQAEEAARKVDGVLEVENRIQVIREQSFRRM